MNFQDLALNACFVLMYVHREPQHPLLKKVALDQGRQVMFSEEDGTLTLGPRVNIPAEALVIEVTIFGFTGERPKPIEKPAYCR